MNLAYPIEDTAEIDGVTYELDMSFDNILRLFDLIKDVSINDVTKVETGLLMLINDDLEQYDIETKAQIFIDLFKNAIGADEEKHQAVDLAGNPMPKMTDDDEKAHIPIEIGDLTLKFDMTDENIDRLYNTYEKMAEKFKDIETNDVESSKKVMKEAFDYILGDGAFDKVYALSGSILVTTEYFEAITNGIRDEVQKRTKQTNQKKVEKYLQNKKKKNEQKSKKK